MPKRESDPRFYALRNAAESNLAQAQELVDQDPTIVAARNSIDETAFHFLVVENDRQAAQWLLEHGSEINTRDHCGESPLMAAALLGHLEMCRFLLARGADHKRQDQEGDTALSKAARAGEQAVVELLLRQFDQEQSPKDINAYFDDFTAAWVLENGGPIAALLQARGLTSQW